MTDESNQQPTSAPDGATADKPVIPTEAEESFKEHKSKGLFHHECKHCEKHKKESEEHLNNWRRALADYDNLKKETASRRAEWAKYSEQQILEEFIPVYDNFKVAFAHLPLMEGENQRGCEHWAQGIEHIKKQFGDIFKAHGVEEIKTVGEKFDPNLHEAVGHESEPDGSIHGKPEQDIIVKEIAGGYKMGERVIRAAKVIVVK